MVKKIFDIIPPGYSESEEKKQSFDWADKGLKPRNSRRSDKRYSSLPGIIIFFLVIGLTAVGAAYFLIDAKASVAIWPKQEPIAKGEQISLKEGISQIDFEGKYIPAVLMEKTKTYTEAVSSTGAIGTKPKAAGTIRLYNKFEPPKAFTFVKGTRFISSDGKIFKATGDIKLPEAKYDKSKLAASYVDVQVEAAEGGSDYNIPASDFSVPGLSGTNSYSSIWGKSDKAMEGGSETGTKMVTQEDMDRARKQFADSAFQRAKQDLAEDVPSGSILLDDFLFQEAAGEQTFSAKEKDQRDTLEISGEITSKALIFKEKDINDYADNLIRRGLSTKVVVLGSRKASYERGDVNFSQKTAELNLSVSAKTYTSGTYTSDKQGIKDSLKGQSLDSAQSMLDNSSEVERSDIKITPFWKKDLPADTSKIDVTISFEQ
jgi:hypothetical protein